MRFVPGDGSKHVGDCGQAQFERVQLAHDDPLQVQALQILQTLHTHTHTDHKDKLFSDLFTFNSTLKCQLKIIKTWIHFSHLIQKVKLINQTYGLYFLGFLRLWLKSE